MPEILGKLFEDASIHTIDHYDKHGLLRGNDGDNLVQKLLNWQEALFRLRYPIPSP
jgi:hypothetical protein